MNVLNNIKATAGKYFAENPDGPLRMVCLRNPWGCGEWDALWSDLDLAWHYYPNVAKLLKQEVSNDGTFWMQYSDYFNQFDYVF